MTEVRRGTTFRTSHGTQVVFVGWLTKGVALVEAITRNGVITTQVLFSDLVVEE